MIVDNKFLIKNLKYICIIGYSPIIEEIIKFNNKNNLKTIFITSSDQAKKLNKKIKFKVFDKIDYTFKSYIKKNIEIEKTLFFSFGARYIFKKDIIDNFFKKNLINSHSRRLPLDAGSGGFSWNIMREDRIHNLLFHLVDESIDTGKILFHRKSLFPSFCKIPKDYEDYHLIKFLKFYSDFIIGLKSKKKFILQSQITYIGRYNPRLDSLKDNWIDWSLESYDLINFINAFDEPYIGASTYLNRGNFGRLFIKSSQLHGGDSSNHPFMSGIVSRHDKDWILVSTKSKHMLIVEKVLNEKGQNIIDQIKVGDRFFTPFNHLEESKSKKTVISSKGRR